MNKWIKIGAFWGLIAAISYLLGETIKLPFPGSTWLGKLILIPIAIFWIPVWFAVLLGFRFQLVFIGAPIAGALVGAIIGYLYDKWKTSK